MNALAGSAIAVKSPNPEPVPPRIALKLPGIPNKLAQADVRTMSPSLDPSHLSPEALMATLWVTVQSLVKSVDEIKKHQTWQMRIAVGGLVAIIGTLFATLLHLAGSYLSALSQHK